MSETDKRIAILGASSMVGVPVIRHLGKENIEAPSHQEVDLTNPESILRYLDKHPEVKTLINFAAYTDVSAAQNKNKPEEAEKCLQINVKGVENLIKALESRKDIFLIHISTDMVFPGSEEFPGPYTEDMIPPDDPSKLTIYGNSKRRGELIAKNHPNVAIIRIIYPVTYEGKPDYLRLPLKIFKEKKKLYPIFNDQQVNITDVDDLAIVIAILIENRRHGIYHVSASDLTTPFEILKQLFLESLGQDDMVTEGSARKLMEELNDPYRYPTKGGLRSDWTQGKFGIYFPKNKDTITKYHGKK